MLSTFGPSTIETAKFASLTKHELGTTFTNGKDDNHGLNDDIEMTFG